MKALVYTGPEDLEIQDVPDPIPQQGEALIDVKAVGICGSDMHAYLGHDERRPAPLILGHEAAGVVAEGPHEGKRVTINPLVACGQCNACLAGRANLCPKRQIMSIMPRQGAFAERVTAPVDNLVEIPDDIGFDIASLVEPMACGWHAAHLAQRALTVPLDEADCLVIGGGAIGLGAALALNAMGAGQVTMSETNPQRRGVVETVEGVHLADPTADSADLVVDAVGFAATRDIASRTVRPGGVIVHIGLGEAKGGLDIRRMTLQEITFIGTYTYMPDEFRQTARAIFDGHLGALDWPECRPLSDGAQAFRDLRAGYGAPKIILTP